jgi:hypothetical protein
MTSRDVADPGTDWVANIITAVSAQEPKPAGDDHPAPATGYDADGCKRCSDEPPKIWY